MNIANDEIEVRNFIEADFNTFYQLTSDKESHKTAGLEYEPNENKSKNIFDKYLVLANSYAVALKSSHQMLGIIELNERGVSNGLDKTREVGFIIAPVFRHKGYATQALKLILNYGFKTLALTEIWASVKTNNAVPQTLLTKLGFRYIYQVSQDPLHLESHENMLKYYLLKNEDGTD